MPRGVARNTAALVGQQFGDRIVIAVVPPKTLKTPGRHVVVRCSDGHEVIVRARYLLEGTSLRCHKCGSKHGFARRGSRKAPEYMAYHAMVSRCYNLNDTAHYPDYGGRGIRVCPEWLGSGGFSRFLAYVGPRPSPELSIDRIDNNRGYEPGNVRWATRAQQGRNTRYTRFLTARGETKCVTDWGEAVGVRAELITTRIDRLGWDTERAIFTPITAIDLTPNTRCAYCGTLIYRPRAMRHGRRFCNREEMYAFRRENLWTHNQKSRKPGRHNGGRGR